MGRPILSVDSIIPWPEALDWIKRRYWTEPSCSSLSSNCKYSLTSCLRLLSPYLPRHDGLYSQTVRHRENSFFFKVAFVGYFFSPNSEKSEKYIIGIILVSDIHDYIDIKSRKFVNTHIVGLYSQSLYFSRPWEYPIIPISSTFYSVVW